MIPLGLLACAGAPTDGVAPRDPTDGVAPRDDSGPPPVDTAPEGGALDAALWSITARFAWDPALGRALPYADRDTGVLPITLAVTLLDGSVLDGATIDDTTSCRATFSFSEPIAPEPLGTAWVGFGFPYAEAEVRDTCAFYALPPEFAGELAPHVARWAPAVGIGPLDEDLETALRDSLPAAQWDALEPLLVGGGAGSALFATATDASGYLPAGFATAAQVDGSFVLVEDPLGDPTPIAAEAVWDPGVGGPAGLARAMYQIDVGPFTDGAALTQGAR